MSFETASPKHEQSIDHKVIIHDLELAVDALDKAGFMRKKIEVYILSGLPEQPPEITLDDMLYVHGLGVKIRLAQFSPIPGTNDWQNAVVLGMDSHIDLINTNTSFFARQYLNLLL